MYCKCSKNSFINIKQHNKSKKHINFTYNSHWKEVIFERDSIDIPNNYNELKQMCELIYFELLIEGCIDKLIIEE